MKPLIHPAFALAFGLLTASLAQAGPPPRVYIPTTGERAEVLIIDAATQQMIGRLGGLPAAHGLAVTPNGSRLVVGSFEERAPDAAMPDKSAGVSAADHAAHHGAGPKAETPDAISTVSIVDAATQAILRRIDVPGAVHHVAVSPDGRIAVVTQPGTDSITAIDRGATPFWRRSGLARCRTTRRIATGASPEHLVLAPDGQGL